MLVDRNWVCISIDSLCFYRHPRNQNVYWWALRVNRQSSSNALFPMLVQFDSRISFDTRNFYRHSVFPSTVCISIDILNFVRQGILKISLHNHTSCVKHWLQGQNRTRPSANGLTCSFAYQKHWLDLNVCALNFYRQTAFISKPR